MTAPTRIAPTAVPPLPGQGAAREKAIAAASGSAQTRIARRAARPRIADDMPDCSVRSALVIAPGRWRMRNGHVAEITGQANLTYQVRGRDEVFPIWLGRCVACDEARTWNANGTYAAIGRHGFDLIGVAV